MTFCPNCGNQSKEDIQICPTCGKEIKPVEKIGKAKFKGTILMPSADAMIRTQSEPQPPPSSKTESSKQSYSSETSNVEKKQTENSKLAFQATMMGAGQVSTAHISNREQDPSLSATALQTPLQNNQLVQNPIAHSDPLKETENKTPGKFKGTVIAGVVPPPVMHQEKEGSHSGMNNTQNGTQSSQMPTDTGSPLNGDEVAITANNPGDTDNQESYDQAIHQPETYTPLPVARKNKNNTVVWMGIGLLGILVLVAIAYGVLF